MRHCSAGYTEAGAWQHRFEVPLDPAGLAAALAAIGVDAVATMEASNYMPPLFHVAGYGGEIHEQAEFAERCWGQWVSF